MTEQDVFLGEVQKMHEDTFTKSVLLPLFKKMGYFDVHFNGGVVEEGKDLLAFKEGEFGGYIVTVVQAKKVKKKGRLDKKKVQEYMMQLAQCLNNTVKYKDGKEYLPSKVYFATPFIVNTRVIREQFEAIRNLDGKIEVIDGALIYKQVKRLAPELIEKFVTSPADKIAASVKELQNVELLKAIRASEDPVKENFYSDLDFFVGKADSNTILNCAIEAKMNTFCLQRSQWLKVRKYVWYLCENSMMQPSISTIESNYQAWDELYRSKDNNDNSQRLSEMKEEFEKAKQDLLECLRQESLSLGIRISKADEAKELLLQESLHDVRASLRFLILSVEKIDAGSINEIKGDIEEVGSSGYVDLKNIRFFKSLLKRIGVMLEGIRKIEPIIVSEPEYIFEVAPKNVEDWWVGVAGWYRSSVRSMNSGELDHDEVKVFLDKVRRVLTIINAMIMVDEEVGSFFSLVEGAGCEDRISVSIQDIFNTGVNAALYGEAGAGKTTTLQVYSKNEIEKEDSSKNVYYFPLNRVVSATKDIEAEYFNYLSDYEKFFLCLLYYRGFDNPVESLGRAIDAVSSGAKSVFIFDGLDEAIKVAPWIIKAINQLPQKFPSCQVIVSSRDCVKYIEEIEFVGLTLLPFNESQLERFVYGWIEEDDKAFKVVEDLKERNLINIVKNPLLATIICDLYKKGVDIPRSEIEIYRKRIRLLSGMYDNFKDIVRTVNTQDDLEEAARKVAFLLHVRQVRQTSREKIVDILIESSHGKLSRAASESLFEELVNPCNILKKVPMEDAYSFGHLRFQEHLAAEEIMRRRDFDIASATRFDWWSGVLYLYASENPIDGLVDEIYQKYGSLSDSKVCLTKMISAKGDLERQDIGSLIERLIEQDSYMLDEVDYYTQDDDSREFIESFLK